MCFIYPLRRTFNMMSTSQKKWIFLSILVLCGVGLITLFLGPFKQAFYVEQDLHNLSSDGENNMNENSKINSKLDIYSFEDNTGLSLGDESNNENPDLRNSKVLFVQHIKGYSAAAALPPILYDQAEKEMKQSKPGYMFSKHLSKDFTDTSTSTKSIETNTSNGAFSIFNDFFAMPYNNAEATTTQTSTAPVGLIELTSVPNLDAKTPWRGEIGAFTDYNNDMYTDMIFFSKPQGESKESVIMVYTWDQSSQKFSLYTTASISCNVDNIIALDWNMDSHVDLIVTCILDDQTPSPRKYYLEAYVQREKGRLEKVWNSQEATALYIEHNQSKRQKESILEQQERNINASSSDIVGGNQGDSIENIDTSTPIEKDAVLTTARLQKHLNLPVDPLSESAADLFNTYAKGMKDSEIEAAGLSDIHPIVLDINMDGYIDILIQVPNENKRILWVNGASHGFEAFLPLQWERATDYIYNAPLVAYSRIANPHSSAVADIDGDCRSDLLFVVESQNDLYIELWVNKLDASRALYAADKKFLYKLPKGAGQISVADFNGDGTNDVLVPSCQRDSRGVCVGEDKFTLLTNVQPPLCGAFFVNPNKGPCRRAYELCSPNSDFVLNDVSSENPPISFPLDPDNSIHFYGDTLRPATLSIGDYDGDGYVDLALPVVKNGGVRSARIYRNVEIIQKNITTRSFQVADEYLTSDTTPGLLFDRAVFFDAWDDGELDLLCLGQPSPPSESPDPFSSIRIYKPDNKGLSDVRFFKSTALNGACPFLFCTNNTVALNGKSPSKVSEVASSIMQKIIPDSPVVHAAIAFGASFKLTVVDLKGFKTPRVGTQYSQSAHSPLQLPYVLFGLGQTNNYVEEFFLGLTLAQMTHYSMWIALIPNSQVVLVPYPLDRPTLWRLELSVYPSKSLPTIFFTTLACLVLVAVIIFILDRREKAEDSEQQRGFRSQFIIN